MPRFKPKGMLERDPLADLWKHTLSGIPTRCGRLVYLTGLRDPNSGAYRHHGLSLAFGREESGRTLRESHRQIFIEWLNLPLSEKSADLMTYFGSLEEENAVIATSWIRTSYPASIVPDQASLAQRNHFLQEMGTLLELIRNQAGAAGVQSPDSARPA
jgi:hypothetical protein